MAMPPPMPRVSACCGRLVGGVDALGQPEGDAGGGQQRDQDDGQAVGRQPAEERRAPLDAAEAGALGGDGVARRAARAPTRPRCGSVRGAARRCVWSSCGGSVVSRHGRAPSCGRARGGPPADPGVDARRAGGQTTGRSRSPVRGTPATRSEDGGDGAAGGRGQRRGCPAGRLVARPGRGDRAGCWRGWPRCPAGR